MIPYNDFRRLLTDAGECETLEQYIAEVGGSVPLDDVDEVIRTLTTIWGLASDGLTIKSISRALKIPVRQISIQYGMAMRTVEQWSSGTRNPPEWMLPMVAYAVMSDVYGDVDG